MTSPGPQLPGGYDGSRYPSKNAACAKMQVLTSPVGRGRCGAGFHWRQFLRAVIHFKSTIAATYHADQVSPEPTMVACCGLGLLPGAGSIKSRHSFKSAALLALRAGKAGAVASSSQPSPLAILRSAFVRQLLPAIVNTTPYEPASDAGRRMAVGRSKPCVKPGPQIVRRRCRQ